MLLRTALTLGPLELRVLRLLWGKGSATVRELYDSGNFDLAYTTLMTTLDRLHKKGVLNRTAEGRAFRYAPRQTEQEFNGAMIRSTIRHMLGTAGEAGFPLSFLVDAVSDHDHMLLDELEREIERKRRELETREKR
jgi:predicted transcriptional regulator